MAEKKPAPETAVETARPLVATRQIKVGEFVAHNVGDEVPAANVETNGWEDFVAKPGTKAAANASDDGA